MRATSIEGLHLYPTKSRDDAPTNSLSTDGIVRRAFTFNQAISNQRLAGFINYLTVDLNEFSTVSDNSLAQNLWGAFNTIIVEGTMWNASSDTTNDVTYFRQRFITNYDYESTGRTKTDWGYNSNLDAYKVSFEDQIPSDSNSDPWNPALTLFQWGNGSECVDGTYWFTGTGETSSSTEWNCGVATYNTSVSTNAKGGVDINNNAIPNSNFKYVYTEGSLGSGRVWIMRSRAFNLNDELSDINNNAYLKFWIHGYGSQIGVTSVWISTSSTANEGTATLVKTIGRSIHNPDIEYTQTSHASPYQEVEIDINNFKQDVDHYIYFTMHGRAGFRSDVCIDQVWLEEETGGLNYGHDLTYQTGFPVDSNTYNYQSNPIGIVQVQNRSGETDFANPQVKFGLTFQSDISPSEAQNRIYIKGSYLLL